MELLLVWCQVVALSEKHLPKGSFSQLPLQHNVVSLDVLDNWDAEKDESLSRSRVRLDFFVGIFTGVHIFIWAVTEEYFHD